MDGRRATIYLAAELSGGYREVFADYTNLAEATDYARSRGLHHYETNLSDESVELGIETRFDELTDVLEDLRELVTRDVAVEINGVLASDPDLAALLRTLEAAAPGVSIIVIGRGHERGAELLALPVPNGETWIGEEALLWSDRAPREPAHLRLPR